MTDENALQPPAGGWDRHGYGCALIPDRPLVSVIITCYDQNALLVEAVRSVCWQTYRPLELIVVDDGSAVPVADVLRSAVNSPGIAVRCIRQQNSGMPIARQRGLEESQGTLTQYLDCDDVLLPGKIEEQVTAMNRVPDAVMCYCTTHTFDGVSGKWLGYYLSSNEAFDRILPVALFRRPWGTNSCLWRFEKERAQPVWSPRRHEGWLHDVLAGLDSRPIIHLSAPLAIVRRFGAGHLSDVTGDVRKARRRLLDSYADVRAAMRELESRGLRDDIARAALADRMFLCGVMLRELGEGEHGREAFQWAIRLGDSAFRKVEISATWGLIGLSQTRLPGIAGRVTRWCRGRAISRATSASRQLRVASW